MRETLLAHQVFIICSLLMPPHQKHFYLVFFPPPPSPGPSPGIWTFMDWFIQIPGPPPQPQDHRCIEMHYSVAAFISQTLLLKNQMF